MVLQVRAGYWSVSGLGSLLSGHTGRVYALLLLQEDFPRPPCTVNPQHHTAMHPTTCSIGICPQGGAASLVSYIMYHTVIIYTTATENAGFCLTEVWSASSSVIKYRPDLIPNRAMEILNPNPMYMNQFKKQRDPTRRGPTDHPFQSEVEIQNRPKETQTEREHQHHLLPHFLSFLYYPLSK